MPWQHADMCGIIALLLGGGGGEDDTCMGAYEDLVTCVRRRGPDKWSARSVEGVGHFGGAVLHIRGAEACEQPVAAASGNVLLWNGEVFGGQEVGEAQSDTLLVAALLDECESHADVVRVLASIQGPYAIVYYHVKLRSVYYGRDPFGRRSLVVGTSTLASSGARVVIASVVNPMASPNVQWAEVPVGGIYVHTPGEQFAPRLVSWPVERCTLERPVENFGTAELATISQAELEQAVDTFEQLLLDAVRRRVACLHRENDTKSADETDGALSSANVAVLFSGGLDSTVVAAMAHLCAPPGEPIDLLNVSFDSAERAPDRLAAICSLVDLKQLYPEREWRLVHIDVPPAELAAHTTRITNLVFPCTTHMDFNIGSAFWFASRGAGYVMDYDCDSVMQCLKVNREGQALLRQAAGHVEGENQSSMASATESKETVTSNPCSNCRRVAKIGCTYDLCKKCCAQRMQQDEDAERCYVHKPRSKEEQKNTSKEDLNLASIMLSATYKSKAKVLLIGIGADEQMAGYGRHRSVFLKSGWAGLQHELQLDTGRLWQRNLGRDDRCTSDHGREARFPFLDEEVVQFLHVTPLNVIADLSLPAGQGDKRLLRQIASRMGLVACAGLVKRAIQFGTRAAQQTNKRVHGSNRKGKGDTLFESKGEV